MQVPAVRVATSEDLLNKGEYVFIPARPQEVHYQSEAIPNPGFFRRLLGRTYTMKRIENPVWPKIDTIVLNCPKCNGTLGTTKDHTILSVEPLHLDMPLTCPYCRTFTFEVKNGNLNELNAVALA
jgi:uncharacterized protein YbaR (Trm112 family)